MEARKRAFRYFLKKDFVTNLLIKRDEEGQAEKRETDRSAYLPNHVGPFSLIKFTNSYLFAKLTG